jgi:hypothetical protein
VQILSISYPVWQISITLLGYLSKNVNYTTSALLAELIQASFPAVSAKRMNGGAVVLTALSIRALSFHQLVVKSA